MKAKLIFCLCWLSCALCAQNKFVYVCFNPQEGGSTPLVKQIDEWYAHIDTVACFLDDGNHPHMATSQEEWEDDIRPLLLQAQNPFETYSDDALNQYLSQILQESVSTNTYSDRLQIVGANDAHWSCSFILSPQMALTEMERIINIIQSNELTTRMPQRVQVYVIGETGLQERPIAL